MARMKPTMVVENTLNQGCMQYGMVEKTRIRDTRILMVASLVLATALIGIDVKLALGACNWKFEQLAV